MTQYHEFGISIDDFPINNRIVDLNGIGYFDENTKDTINEMIINKFRSIEWGNCAYGAASFPVIPIIIKISQDKIIKTAKDVLDEIKPKYFKSDHIKKLDAEIIDFPGYHPGTNNDEIHNNDEKQNIFLKEEDRDDENTSYENHQILKDLVKDRKLWYILLHSKKHKYGDSEFCDYVLLMAIGLSPDRKHLIGVVTSQVCHNLCD